MDRRIWRQFDLVLVGIVVLLILYGVIMVFSANQNQEDLRDLWWTQLTRAGLGLGLLVAVAAIDYRYYASLHRFLYVVMLIFLGTLFLAAELTAGTLRWLDFTLFPVQPSEIAKIIIIIVTAKLLADRDGEMNKLSNLFYSMIVIVPPLVLIYLQPDLGTTIIAAVVWLIMVLMAGGNLFHIGLVGLGGILVSPIIWLTMAEYQRDRVLLFMNPDQTDPSYFNIQQALISIGSGGLLGKGFSIGTQNQLHFLRVRHTDFIFSVIGEELGMLGALLLFLLIVGVIWRILRAADLTKDPFGRSICIGVAALIFFQSFVNLGVNLGLLPVTGTPLPFVSYGGSSLFAFLIALGLVQSVLMRHKALDFEEV
ncbi:MAG: rod shape-determining protein RodA [Anaerolineae bacterium]|nr:rod shape-determining protein RodA [Anaerolineae bacterium]MCB0178029.1 rod shape-determining protein RodA [Anaerolineae bacterium]MCB9107175.1 rod shape-determining protein RodA [Anaerolineales bacterium]